MVFRIYEVDRDYRALVGFEYRSFPNQREADEWCEKETWTGFWYSAELVSASIEQLAPRTKED